MGYNSQAVNSASNYPTNAFGVISNTAILSNPTHTKTLNVIPRQMAAYSQPVTAFQTAYSNSLVAAQTAFSKPVTAAENVQYHPLTLQSQTQQIEKPSEKPTNPAVANLTGEPTTASVDSNATIKNANNESSGDEADLENQGNMQCK